MKNKYKEIKVEWMSDGHGGFSAFFAKGHHDRQKFLDELKHWLAENQEFGSDLAGYVGHRYLTDTAYVHQTYCRVNPLSKEAQENLGYNFEYMYRLEPGKQGVFPITIVDGFA